MVFLVALLLLMQEQPPYEPPDQYPQVIEAKEVPSNESLRLWETFKAKYGQHWQVEWNTQTGVPKDLRHESYITGINATDKNKAEEIARSFISDIKDLYKIRMSDLRSPAIQDKGDIWSIDFNQEYDGIPVYQAGLGMSITKGGNIISFGGDYYPNLSIPTTPKITNEQAVEIAKREINAELMGEGIAQIKDNTILMILPQEEGNTISYHLTWKVRILADRGKLDTVVFVDALNGEVVRWYSNIFSVIFSIQGHVNGTIYPKNPSDTPISKEFSSQYIHIMDDDAASDQEMKKVVTDSNGNYNTGSIDGSNWDNPGDPDTDADVYLLTHLEGPYADVLNDNSARAERFEPYGHPYSSQIYNIDWGLGDEQNAFYQTVKVHDFFAGSPFAYNRSVVTVTVNVNMNNAEGGPYAINLGNVQPFARSSDAIFHEYTHGIIWFLYNGSYIGRYNTSGCIPNYMGGCMMDEDCRLLCKYDK